VRFERRARLACACSLQPAVRIGWPRTRGAPAPEASLGPLGSRQERASVAQRVLGVKVRQNGFCGPLVRAKTKLESALETLSVSQNTNFKLFPTALNTETETSFVLMI